MSRSQNKFIIFITVIFLDLLTGMEFDLFTPSFPELQNQFALTPVWIEALLSINFVGYCLSMFFVGHYADLFGRRPVILVGLTIFVIGSALCLSGNYPLLLLGRFLQGLGIAAPAILSFVIISDHYPVDKQQLFMGILNGFLNAGCAAAPILGSYLTLYFHWQGNFFVLLSLGLIALVMAISFIPQSSSSTQSDTNAIKHYSLLFKSDTLLLLIGYFVLMFVPYWIFVGMSPLLYMKDLGVSLSHFGFYQGIYALIFAIGSVLFGLIVTRFDQRKYLLLSNYIFALSFICVCYITLTNNTDPVHITLAFIPFVIAQIIPSTILYPLCLNLNPKLKGTISGAIQGTRLILCAVSLQIASYFYNANFSSIGYIILFFIGLAILMLHWLLKFHWQKIVNAI